MEARREKKDKMFRPALAKRQDWELAGSMDCMMEGMSEGAVGIVWVAEGMPEVVLEPEVPSEAATISAAVHNVNTRERQERGGQQKNSK